MEDDLPVSLPLPPGACDCHLHLFGDGSRYPVRHPKSLYGIDPAWTVDTLQSIHKGLGITRYVAVQPTAYAMDHSFLTDFLQHQPRERTCGVAIIDDTMDDRALQRLHDAGVRGARFNFQKRFGLVPSMDEFHRCVDRIRPLGWFIKIFFLDELSEIEADIRKASITTIVDHLGPRPDFQAGTASRDFRRLCDLLRGEEWWIMLSNGHRRSQAGKPWTDMTAFGRALYEAAPERAIWGTDWPHVTEKSPFPEADLLGLLRSYLPDENAFRQVLVDNPARLFDFAQSG